MALRYVLEVDQPGLTDGLVKVIWEKERNPGLPLDFWFEPLDS